MNLGIIVNQVNEEMPRHTSLVIGWAAACRGHDVYVLGAGDFICFSDGSLGANAVKFEARATEHVEEFSAAITRSSAERTVVRVDELDVLFNRSDPTIELIERPWAQTAPIVFSQAAANRGVLALPDPPAQWNNLDKLYLQWLPERIRPKGLVTRDLEAIRQFWEENDRHIVIKPLLGSRGTDVFLLADDAANLPQMVEAVARSGYIFAQEYIPAAQEGDVRLFMLNGRPLMKKGKIAAFRRFNEGELRSNMSAGGKPKKTEITDAMLEIAEAVRPLFIRDGIFFAGLDIAGDKLLEVNVSSPGGLYTAGKIARMDFSDIVVEALERKVAYRKTFGSVLSNRDLACME